MTLTQTEQPSPTPSYSPAVSPTATPLILGNLTPSAPPSRPGRPRPRSVLALPNPQSGAALSLAVDLEADADSLRIDIYTKSMTRLGRHELRGPFFAGWNRLSLALDLRPVSGLYYVVVSGCKDNGETEAAKVSKVYYLQ